MARKHFAVLAMTTLLFGVASCAVKRPSETLVFIPKGTVQCESVGMTLDESIKRLTSVGVSAQSSQCAERTGIMFSAVCGAETGDIIVHAIPTKEVILAERAGYQKVEELGNGMGYTVKECR